MKRSQYNKTYKRIRDPVIPNFFIDSNKFSATFAIKLWQRLWPLEF